MGKICSSNMFVRVGSWQSCNSAYTPNFYFRDCTCEDLRVGDTFFFEAIGRDGCGADGGDWTYYLKNNRNNNLVLFKGGGMHRGNQWLIHNQRISESYFEILTEPNSMVCYCSDDSCRVDCATAPDGFCCIDHSLTDRLLQIIKT